MIAIIEGCRGATGNVRDANPPDRGALVWLLEFDQACTQESPGDQVFSSSSIANTRPVPLHFTMSFQLLNAYLVKHVPNLTRVPAWLARRTNPYLLTILRPH